MLRRIIVVFTLVVLVTVSVNVTGCGYILHPERRKAHTSRIDPLTVTFDALWILAGVIPGVVALIVDGVKDTWYFAPGEKAELAPYFPREKCLAGIADGTTGSEV